ncbi:MAG: hypothetical protein LH470_01565 [Lysobacter sp.]|nr:hypothetical protein [Lysobacter sp.]
MHATQAPDVALAFPITVSVYAAALAKLPRESISTRAHGQALRCEGVSLLAVLRASNAMPAEPLRGAHLARYVLVNARDGYRAIYSLAELDPSLGNTRCCSSIVATASHWLTKMVRCA